MAFNYKCVLTLLLGTVVVGEGRSRSTRRSTPSFTVGCSTDADCPYDGNFRCCGDTLNAENCPPLGLSQASSSSSSLSSSSSSVGYPTNCVLPGSAGATNCSCSSGGECGIPNYPEPAPNMKQWLMIGDSISYGLLGPTKIMAEAKGVEVYHHPSNAANVWWGSHCLDGWLANASRWDIITFNFGLHDLALDNERLEPNTTYSKWLADIVTRIVTKAPQAKIVWVTTTPVPMGIAGFCNKTDGEGGCPPRRYTDPPIYNAWAKKTIEELPVASKIGSFDLYSVVTAKCGTNYTLCPENCHAEKTSGKWIGNCFQIPHNVHYLPSAWDTLATSFVNAIISQ